MTILLCILSWIACGFLAVWVKYALVDNREFDMPLVEAVTMATVFGACLLIGAIIITPMMVATRHKGTVLWKAKK